MLVKKGLASWEKDEGWTHEKLCKQGRPLQGPHYVVRHCKVDNPGKRRRTSIFTKTAASHVSYQKCILFIIFTYVWGQMLAACWNNHRNWHRKGTTCTWECNKNRIGTFKQGWAQLTEILRYIYYIISKEIRTLRFVREVVFYKAGSVYVWSMLHAKEKTIERNTCEVETTTRRIR